MLLTNALLKALLDGRNFRSSNANRGHTQGDVTLLSFYFYLKLLYFNLASVIG